MSVEAPGRPDASGRGAAFSGAAGGDELTVVEPLVFERSRAERRAVRFPHASDAAREAGAGQPQLPASVLRAEAPRLPEVSELDLLRHFNRLAHLNQAIDLNFYPLGSCTMKYNPKVNEWAARLPGLAESHPLDPGELSQGSLELMWLLAELLKEISGFGAISLQPAAGAHGELTGILMARAYHRANGEGDQRTKVLVPDSAHGTNPATATMAGYQTVTIRSNERGGIDLDALRAALGPDTAALMITNPSTLGIFEDQIDQVVAAVKEAGGIAYMDGANLNAILGRFRPGEAGFDIMHFNLHKTFSTPHGGGGPGAGPVGVSERLEPFLPRADAGPGRRRSGRGTSERLGGTLDARRSFRARRRSPAQHRQGPLALRQLRHVRAGLHLHPQQRRRRPAHDQRGCRPCRQLPPDSSSTTSTTCRMTA